MDEKKLKIAFNKVKKDIFGLARELDVLKENQKVQNNNVVKNSSNESNYDILAQKVFNVENKIKALEDTNKFNFGKSTTLKSEIDFIKKKTNDVMEESIRNIKQIDDKFNDFTVLITEKINLEVADLRLNVAENLSQSSSSKDLRDIKYEIIQSLDEKIQIQVNEIRNDFTSEIAKIYDKVFNELLDLKTQIDRISSSKEFSRVKKQDKDKGADKESSSPPLPPKIDKKQSEKEVQQNQEKDLVDDLDSKKKESKLKRFTKWLFIDEEDDNRQEIDDIKSDVKEKNQ